MFLNSIRKALILYFTNKRAEIQRHQEITWLVSNGTTMATYFYIKAYLSEQGNSRKTSTCDSLTTVKPLIVWITTNCGKFLKRIPEY